MSRYASESVQTRRQAPLKETRWHKWPHCILDDWQVVSDQGGKKEEGHGSDDRAAVAAAVRPRAVNFGGLAMKFVSSDDLSPNRAYLTIFDRVTYSQVAWTPADVEAIRQALERQLKFILLIKGHVVVAASHLLESELAHEVLLPHERLFSEGIIVPALRSEFDSFVQFLDGKLAECEETDEYAGTQRREVAEALDATTTGPCLLQLARSWFRDWTCWGYTEPRTTSRGESADF